MDPIKILLADDHEVIRDGVKALLERDASFVVVGEAASGFDAVKKVSDLRPEVLLMDISMPPGNGIDAATEIRQCHPECKIVMLSMHHDADTITRCLEIDVMGYVVKSQGGSEIINAIKSVHAGKKFYSEAVTRAIIEKYTEAKNISVSKKQSLNELTNREREIIGYIAQGWTNQKIADTLFISFRTVETHRANLMRKLEAKNSIELVNKARELDLL